MKRELKHESKHELNPQRDARNAGRERETRLHDDDRKIGRGQAVSRARPAKFFERKRPSPPLKIV
ncbi:hypothetical protein, partial [Burkholderia sp. SIMBA_051]|uniref:hypothetical protein n=1 Tax=Burkholderia sp. SIMBA_051 TaxID=3085792 RepID=UPI00397DD6E5